jgi:hypothetical protein
MRGEYIAFGIGLFSSRKEQEISGGMKVFRLSLGAEDGLKSDLDDPCRIFTQLLSSAILSRPGLKTHRRTVSEISGPSKY